MSEHIIICLSTKLSGHVAYLQVVGLLGNLKVAQMLKYLIIQYNNLVYS